MTPAENARLLGWVEHMLRSPLCSDRERAFLLAVRGQHKPRPGMVLSEKQAPWLADLVARFPAETMGGEAATEDERPNSTQGMFAETGAAGRNT